MICAQCNKEFTPTHHAVKYCSKECIKIKNIEWKKKYFTPEKRKETRLKYKSSPKNKKTHDDYNKKYFNNNPDYLKDYFENLSDEKKAKYKYERKEFFLNYFRKRRKEPLFRLISNLRSRTSVILKSKGLKKNSGILKILGCTLPELKNHLEKKFLPGMNWRNNSLDGWHVDHIVPISSAKTSEGIIRLCHYTNLQPLWAIDNIRKSNKILPD